MMLSLRSLLRAMVEEGRTLTREEARALLGQILAEEIVPSEIATEVAALLTAMAMRGETAAELTGFAEAMRAAATPLPLTDDERAQLVDTCGTGGDGHGTFNISTGAALVAAAAGARVAKHGNRAVTSRCGSADVLEALGIPIALAPEAAVECLRATGFLFLLATSLHPAMRRLAPVRRALGFRTIFNLAGPLTNPAGARAQVLGVWARDRMGVVAEAIASLGARHAFVVHGESAGGAGLDELTVTGASHLAEVRDRDNGTGGHGTGGDEPGATCFWSIEPEELGLARASLNELGGGGSPEESAAVLLAIFGGQERGPRRAIVLFNAAAALVAGGVAPDLREGIARAAEAIDSGAALRIVNLLRQAGGSRT